MKLELPVIPPENIKEMWEGQFSVFSWYQFVINIPTPIFIVTTLKENGLANAQLSAWGMMAGSGSEPKFILQVHNYTETRKLIESTGEFVVNYPTLALKEKFMQCASKYDAGTDELMASGLSHEQSKLVKAPRVKECFAHFECKVDWIRDIESEARFSSLVQGSIVHAAISGEVLSDDIRTASRNRDWAYLISEQLNPETGNHVPGIMSTLDITSSVDI